MAIKYPTSMEAEAVEDVKRARELHDMLWGKTRYLCGDCGAWWTQTGTAEVCPTCNCPSPIIRTQEQPNDPRDG